MGIFLQFPRFFWLFCTEEQLSVCHFIQFCILTKKYIEIHACFVYNVIIVVPKHQLEGFALPKGVNYHVHSKRDP